MLELCGHIVLVTATRWCYQGPQVSRQTHTYQAKTLLTSWKTFTIQILAMLPEMKVYP